MKAYAKESQPSGGGKELARVLRVLDGRLRREPLELGEVYRLRGAVAEHLAVREFVTIDFAVDQVRRFVLVRSCWLSTAPQS